MHSIILAAGSVLTEELPPLLTKWRGKITLERISENIPKDFSDLYIVLGFNKQKFKKFNKSFKFINNVNWETNGSAGSFFCGLDKLTDSTLVFYGDVIFEKYVLRDIIEKDADIVVAYDNVILNSDDSQKLHNEIIYLHDKVVTSIGSGFINSENKKKFVGITKLNKRTLEFLKNISQNDKKNLSKLPFSNLLEFLRINGFSIDVVSVKSAWAETEYPEDVARLILGSKSETLKELKTKLRFSNILPQIDFSLQEYSENKQGIINQIKSKFKKELSTTGLVVRSSSIMEDNFENSSAGKFESILNVKNEKLVSSIDKVISSFGKNKSLNDKVLIQPMLTDISLNGVCFTRTNQQGAPWYIINYVRGNDTTDITGGKSKNHKTAYISKDIKILPKNLSHLNQVLKCVREIEEIVEFDSLDIEFAITCKKYLYIFQVRPLNKNKEAINYDDDEYFNNLNFAVEKYVHYSNTNNHFSGNTKNIFGIMPDWNPAEIIGTSPGNLSTSLYKYLITDEIWAQQRYEYGYKDLRGLPLMVEFLGRPYIDVSLSMCSFIPNSISKNLTKKLLDYYLNHLIQYPDKHDKIELEIVKTCFTPDFNEWAKSLIEKKLFTHNELMSLKEGLKNITKSAFKRGHKDFESLHELEYLHEKIKQNKKIKKIAKIKLLLSYCKQLGTLPFAHLARSAFVAISILKSGVRLGLYSSKKYSEFFNSIETISQEFQNDWKKVKQKKLTFDEYTLKYGHLRPGTYDITSKTYADNPDLFLKSDITILKNDSDCEVKFPNFTNEIKKLTLAFAQNNFFISENDLNDFLTTSIIGREKAKFIFTKILSYALEELAEFGHSHGLSREDLSNIDLNTIYTLEEENPKNSSWDLIKDIIVSNAKKRKLSSFSKLPNIIFTENDIKSFELGFDNPNFVGTKIIVSEIIKITFEKTSLSKDKFKNKIVLIEKADPGFDWIFSTGILGFVTKYGGANSHMAIRAAEFNMTAAIGVGELIFENLEKCKGLRIDPMNNKMNVL